ncbi:879_t:CDS:2, partial [Funneliformis geosporum]
VTNSPRKQQMPNSTPKPAVEVVVASSREANTEKKKIKEKYIRVIDSETERLVSREITYVPALYKIMDEIFVNVADNKVRDQEINVIKFDIDKEGGQFAVFNNGKGIYDEN